MTQQQCPGSRPHPGSKQNVCCCSRTKHCLGMTVALNCDLAARCQRRPDSGRLSLVMRSTLRCQKNYRCVDIVRGNSCVIREGLGWKTVHQRRKDCFRELWK